MHQFFVLLFFFFFFHKSLKQLQTYSKFKLKRPTCRATDMATVAAVKFLACDCQKYKNFMHQPTMGKWLNLVKYSKNVKCQKQFS